MQNYKRIVSYIYAYNGNQKMNNVGFAKLEVRGNAGRLSIKITDRSELGEEVLEVYFLHNMPNLKKLNLEKTCYAKRGCVEEEITFDADKIGADRFDISKMQGLFFETRGESKKVFASAWIDMEIRPEELRDVEVVGEKVEATVEVAEGSGTETLAEIEEASVAEPLDEDIVEGNVTEELCAAVIEDIEGDMEEAEIINTFLEVIEDFERSEAMEINKAEIEKEAVAVPVAQEVKKSPWERLCCKYPKVIAFEKNTGCLCLKIDLRAMELILGSQYRMGSNTFAIRCYCKYRYLLLIENDKDSLGETCLIGAPGIYNQNDNVLAKMCGFNEFRTSKEVERLNGSFGYWIKELKL